jgi:hypothetical protein
MVTPATIFAWIKTITPADIEILSGVPRVEGARTQIESAAKADGRYLGLPNVGERLAERGPIRIDDQSGLWARWAWDFTEPGWQHAERLLDDALAVARFPDLVNDELAESVVGPLSALFGGRDRA